MAYPLVVRSSSTIRSPCSSLPAVTHFGYGRSYGDIRCSTGTMLAYAVISFSNAASHRNSRRRFGLVI